jgi:tetratricopeptide (TPR) repeat protein
MFGYWQMLWGEEHLEVRTALEKALEREPNHADALACLSLLYIAQHRWGYNPRPNPLRRAFELAQRAVALDPGSSLAHRAIAEAHFHGHNVSACRAAADRAIELNPRDITAVAMIGGLIAFSGDWERGCQMVRTAIERDPRHGGFPYSILAWAHYRDREYELAAEAADKINLPGSPFMSAASACSHAQLGHLDTARKHLERLIKIVPAMARDPRAEWSKWTADEEFLDDVVDGLRKAGLEVA